MGSVSVLVSQVYVGHVIVQVILEAPVGDVLFHHSLKPARCLFLLVSACQS